MVTVLLAFVHQATVLQIAAQRETPDIHDIHQELDNRRGSTILRWVTGHKGNPDTPDTGGHATEAASLLGITHLA